MSKPASALFALGMTLWLSTSVTFAHAVLVKSIPGVGEVLSQDTLEIHLIFSEVLEPRFSIFKIEALDGGDEKISVSFDSDRRGVVLRFDKKPDPGGYRVQWKVVAMDTHKSEGLLPFSVR